ncbi:hypothetical protein Ddye_019747 [Dipteronia dyeriana]|uniref:Auxin-responsive protein n=1 Tax=Dipteronia dyeriana TaxID=168575 RepID=A0AAD9WW09_9ROSI|nr:hypothetical protein Ddye_019747 [Dipteronia dyeriana]
MGKDDDGVGAHSCSSSIDSSNNPPADADHHPFLSSSCCGCGVGVEKRSSSSRDLIMSTDLRLGLSISPSQYNHNDVSSTSMQRLELMNWPPIKAVLRSKVAGKTENVCLFVKVYMEGIPIGRKLDLFAHQGYNALITTLSHMFAATILCPAHVTAGVDHCSKHHNVHVLTYEDKEGDWMMVGDVPWEMFLTTVKRLKITRADRC